MITLTNIKKDGNYIKKANVKWHRHANGYRLPTEAEWEYSAKAGTELNYSGSNHLGEVAWYHCNSGEKRLSENLWHDVNCDVKKYAQQLEQNKNRPHEVKTKLPNGWGLYDMSGNISEWCMDQFDDQSYQHRKNGIENPILWKNLYCDRVVRGGSCVDYAEICRNARRGRGVAENRYNNQGFRLLRSAP